MWFTPLTQDTAIVHVDHHYAAQTQFGRALVHSTFTVVLVTASRSPARRPPTSPRT
jgi:itaconyl-CoA hydratase